MFDGVLAGPKGRCGRMRLLLPSLSPIVLVLPMFDAVAASVLPLPLLLLPPIELLAAALPGHEGYEDGDTAGVRVRCGDGDGLMRLILDPTLGVPGPTREDAEIEFLTFSPFLLFTTGGKKRETKEQTGARSWIAILPFWPRPGMASSCSSSPV